MFRYEAARLMSVPLTEVRAAVGTLVVTTWGGRARLVTDDGRLRIDAIVAGPEPDDTDAWLTWQLDPHGDETQVRIVLDEVEPGPDPDLEQLLDLLSDHLAPVAGRPEVADVAVVRAVYAAIAARDLDRIFELLDPAIVITQDQALPWGGTHVGHHGFVEFAARLTGTIDSQVVTDAVFLADGEVVQVGRTQGTVRGSGAPFDVPEVHRWTVRDGKAITAHFAIDTHCMLRALRAAG